MQLMNGITLISSTEKVSAVSTSTDKYQTPVDSMLFTNGDQMDLVLIQLFKRIERKSESTMHADDPLFIKHGKEQSISYWQPQSLVANRAKKMFNVGCNTAAGTMYQLKIRNLWVDGGIVCNIFPESKGAKLLPSGDFVALNEVNVLNPFSTMDFEFKASSTSVSLLIAIAPHIAHNTKASFANCLWRAAKQITVVHFDRDQKKLMFQDRMAKTIKEALPLHKAVQPSAGLAFVDAADLLTSANTPMTIEEVYDDNATIDEPTVISCTKKVATRDNETPCDFMSAFTIALNIK